MEEKDLQAKGKTEKAAAASLARLLSRAQAEGWEILHAPGHGWVKTAFDGTRWLACIRVIRRG